MAEVAAHRHLTAHLIARCEAAGFRLRVAEPAHRSAIVMIHHADPPRAVSHLADHGVIVDHRPGYVGVSPHFYNTEEEVDRCVEALKTLDG